MDRVVITVENVTQRFRVLQERPDTVRELFARFLRHEVKVRKFQALTDVSFTVRQGEMVGLMGRNGAGKSTMLKLIVGVYSVTEGRITVNGSMSPLIELGAGFHPELTGRENILIGGLLMGYSKKEMLRRQDSIIEFAGLGHFIDAPVKQYSSGMYMRLAFSVATEVNPDILILDEVLAVGDIAFQAKCLERLQRFREAGKTILFVTHSPELITDYCDRAILLHKGQVAFDGDPVKAVDLYRASAVPQPPSVFRREPVRIP